MSRVALIVIAKEPVAGRCKTRLTPPLSPEQAAGVAESALAETLDAVVQARASRRALVLDGAPGPWLPSGFELFPQREGGLDSRLVGAFEDVGGPAFLVGMDTPQLTPTMLEQAAGALMEPGTDAVLGLAPDGGYWGVGLRRSNAEVFEGVPMSSERTGELQLKRMRALGLRTTRLPVLRDVDTVSDALEVAAMRPRSRFAVTLAGALDAAALRQQCAPLS